MLRRSLLAAAVLVLPSLAVAQTAVPARNAVLVHGAFADGSSYAGVIPLLQAQGVRVIAVQNPLTSLKDDVAATRRALAQMDGPTVLVGHSYGGTVISEAGDDPKVSSLVFLAALGLEPGETFGDIAKRFPPGPGLGTLQAKDGYVQMSAEGFVKFFMPDVPEAKAKALEATQGPVAATLFEDKTTRAAWQSKPSFYAVATQDQLLPEAMQRFFATRMKATVADVASSHALPISQPDAVAKLILTAAGR